ncbi:major facilitator superfamily domain-containing protein [Echria macrotheca]|uniref:Major facilitator superfamily domain-containing protein n=1 Tax=Echria macrotheca TaxID=438768 RepID=A0AAJ0BK87_9PEZI|nr:major facilitator superfamily domain-containing protein [Echria macrotheca]
MVRPRDRPGADEATPADIGTEEQTPLLNDDRSRLEVHLRIRREQLRLRVTVLAFLVIFVLELGVGMSGPPVNEIMEGIICRQMHPKLDTNPAWGQGGPDDPCKNQDVQSYLAMLRGWTSTFEAIPGILCAVPYGILSDRWGRKPVLVLGILGLALSVAFVMAVFVLSDILPIWVTLFSALCMFLGGGGQMVMAMLYTLLADVVPATERATVFFQIGAAYLVSATVAGPLAGALMTISDWLTLVVCLLILALGIPLALAFPETVSLHGPRKDAGNQARPSAAADDGNDGDDEDEDNEPASKLSPLQNIVAKAREGFSDVRDFVLGNKSLAFLMASSIFVVFAKSVQEMLLQYATKRYGWTWSQATILLAIRGVASLMALLAVLPFATWFCRSRLGMSSVSKDIQLARLSGAVSALGYFIMALAANGYLLASGIVVFSMGAGISSLTRSLLNSLVEEHHVGIVNSLIGWMEMTGLMLGGPLLAESLTIGMRWGGPWIGLPFMVSGTFFIVATVILCVFRPPASTGSRGGARV